MVASPVITAVVSLAGLCTVLVWRVREGRTAVTARKILIPPLGMATGFCMFFVPAFRFPLTWAIGAFLTGAILLAWPLLATSSLRREGDAIMMKRSGAFFAVIIVLAIVRYALPIVTGCDPPPAAYAPHVLRPGICLIPPRACLPLTHLASTPQSRAR